MRSAKAAWSADHSPTRPPCDPKPDHPIVINTGVFNLTKRLAMSNEPYLDEFCMASMEGAMLDAGFTDVERSWPNMERYARSIDCSLRIIIASKPARG